MSICCLSKGEVTFLPFILKMAACSADGLRDIEVNIMAYYTQSALCVIGKP